MRDLATIQLIDSLLPIENADKIELAHVKGWQCVVEKGRHNVGEMVIFIEIDSVMPERPEFEFLQSGGYRIRTVKLRGQISQGIVFPLSILGDSVGDIQPGMDVTKILGVTKYDPPMPACLSGVAKGRFPSHSIKTDEERIQNLKDMYEKFCGERWYVTEKLDGSAATFFVVDDEFGVASRNLLLEETKDNSFWKVARELDIESEMRWYMEYHGVKAMTIQGELIGEGIQKNKYKLKGQTVRFFRVFDPIEYKFQPFSNTITIIKAMGLEMVPIINKDFILPNDFNDLIKYADGRSELYDTDREGIVLVAQKTIFPDYGRSSFKVLSNKFLLKHE